MKSGMIRWNELPAFYFSSENSEDKWQVLLLSGAVRQPKETRISTALNASARRLANSVFHHSRIQLVKSNEWAEERTFIASQPLRFARTKLPEIFRSLKISISVHTSYVKIDRDVTLGTTSAKSSNVIRPAGFPPTSQSKKTFGFFPGVVLIKRFAVTDPSIRWRADALALSNGTTHRRAAILCRVRIRRPVGIHKWKKLVTWSHIPWKSMPTTRESLGKLTKIVADTGDLDR